jgi:glucokinase
VNDANAALVGHTRVALGAPDRSASAPTGGETRVALLLALGTGIGGSIMVGDTIVLGENGYAAELGHVPVDFSDGRVCLCGATGCVEQFASARGVAELAAMTPPPPESQARLAAMGASEPYPARAIVGAASMGDAWATGLLARGGTMLGRAMATLCVMLDPGTVIVAGGFGHAAGTWLLPHAEEELRRRWPYPGARPLPRLTRDVIGPYAAATGAAWLARAAQERGDRR